MRRGRRQRQTPAGRERWRLLRVSAERKLQQAERLQLLKRRVRKERG